jgi:hypothetical protein
MDGKYCPVLGCFVHELLCHLYGLHGKTIADIVSF